MFEGAGLVRIGTYVEDEIATRGEAWFPEPASIWVYVMERIGSRITTAGFLTESECPEATCS